MGQLFLPSLPIIDGLGWSAYSAWTKGPGGLMVPGGNLALKPPTRYLEEAALYCTAIAKYHSKYFFLRSVHLQITRGWKPPRSVLFRFLAQSVGLVLFMDSLLGHL